MASLIDMNEALTVVLVEDDRRLAALTTEFLTRYGVGVHVAYDGREGLDLVLQLQPDVVLLDLMLPSIDGMDICRAIRRKSDVPIIMLSARDSEADRSLGLESGADDYVAKPFSARELLARVRAQTRRARGKMGPETRLIQCGNLSLDIGSRRVTWEGREISLTTYEFDLLKVLAERVNRPIGRERLMDLVKGNADEAFDRSIDFHISKLRHKLGDNARNPRLLKTVRGVGYMVSGADA
jgi:two-component system, OmpR family, response regulator